MDNVIHVNTTSRLLQTLTRGTQSAGSGFGEALQDAENAQYRERIASLIQTMPVSSGRLGDNFRIDISQDGYRAMQSDPAYEAFVLDTVRAALASSPAPNAGTATVILQFGEDASQFRSHTFETGDDIFHILEKDKSFWEERMERQEASDETNEKIAQIRERMQARVLKDRLEGKPTAAAELSASSEILTVLLEQMFGGL